MKHSSTPTNWEIIKDISIWCRQYWILQRSNIVLWNQYSW